MKWNKQPYSEMLGVLIILSHACAAPTEWVPSLKQAIYGKSVQFKESEVGQKK